MLKGIIIVTLAVLNAVSGQQKQDPRCVAKNCPSSTTCRIVKECSQGATCSLVAQCLETPPSNSHTGVCVMGDPILVEKNRALEDLTCGPRRPCPEGAYCNTELQDTYATCCVSDPGAPVKNWTCPANTYQGDDFCLDTCNNDGDCRLDDKCCDHGCKRECVPRPDPCDGKQCPKGSFCQRMGMPSCSAPGECYAEGDCVPCPPVCEIYCQHGNVMDPNGCPTCHCKTGPPPAPGSSRDQGISSSDRNSGSRPGGLWPGSRSRGGPQQWMPFIPPWLWAVLLL